MAEPSTKATQPAVPELDAEFANRLRDPFEQLYMGVIQPNDPLLIERGAGPEIYRDLKRDPKVFDGLQKRQLSLIGKAWQVEPVKKSSKGTQDAETVTALLKASNFDKLCSELLEALIASFVPAEIVWTLRDGLVAPARIVKRSQKRFKFVQVDENSPPQLHLLTRENMLTGVPVPERKFIVHRVNPEDDNPYGTGLGLQLWWPVFFKRKAIVSWNKTNDRVGGPTLHGEYPRNASKKEKETLADALRAFTSDGFVITPEGMKVVLLESKLQGNMTLQQALCEYMDDAISAVLTGQNARSSAGGALAAAAKERADVREDLTQADSDLLSETLNSTLLAWICELNGLEPCHVWRQVKQEDDLQSSAETDKTVSEMGFELTLDAVRAKYGEGWQKKAPPPAPVVVPATSPSAAPAEKPASFAEAPAASAARDALDDLVDTAMADWEQALDPLLAPVQAAIDEALGRGETAGELIARLPQLMQDMDADVLRQSLTKASFVAALGAAAGLSTDLVDGQTGSKVDQWLSRLRARRQDGPAFAEPAAPAAAPPSPQVVVHVHPEIHVPTQPAPVVHNTVQVPEQAPTVVHNNVQLPEQSPPVVNVQPAGVTVVSTHPKRAEQEVVRDTNDEIVKTVTTYFGEE